MPIFQKEQTGKVGQKMVLTNVKTLTTDQMSNGNGDSQLCVRDCGKVES